MPPVYCAEISLSFGLPFICALARLVSVLPFPFTLSLLYICAFWLLMERVTVMLL